MITLDSAGYLYLSLTCQQTSPLHATSAEAVRADKAKTAPPQAVASTIFDVRFIVPLLDALPDIEKHQIRFRSRARRIQVEDDNRRQNRRQARWLYAAMAAPDRASPAPGYVVKRTRGDEPRQLG